MGLQERDREVDGTMLRSIYAWVEKDRFSGTHVLCEECSFSVNELQSVQVRLIRNHAK